MLRLCLLPQTGVFLRAEAKSLIRLGALKCNDCLFPSQTKTPQNIRVPGTCFPMELGDGWAPGGLFFLGCIRGDVLVMEKLDPRPL